MPKRNISLLNILTYVAARTDYSSRELYHVGNDYHYYIDRFGNSTSLDKAKWVCSLTDKSASFIDIIEIKHNDITEEGFTPVIGHKEVVIEGTYKKAFFTNYVKRIKGEVV